MHFFFNLIEISFLNFFDRKSLNFAATILFGYTIMEIDDKKKNEFMFWPHESDCKTDKRNYAICLLLSFAKKTESMAAQEK